MYQKDTPKQKRIKVVLLFCEWKIHKTLKVSRFTKDAF